MRLSIPARTISRRLYLLIGILFVGMVSTVVFASHELRSRLIAERIDHARTMVEVARSLVSDFHLRADRGAMTIEEAKKQALLGVSGLRHANGQYFWINDMGGTMLMHPTASKLVGTSRINSRANYTVSA
jgi:methyl-accepting chemotaxis protein